MRGLLSTVYKKKSQFHQQWVIRPHLPWYKQPSIVIAVSAVVISIIGSYVYLNHALQNTGKQLASITKKYSSLSDKYIDIKIAKIKLQRELEVAQQSQVKIKDNLLTLHEQSQDLTEQVDLYKRIMSGNKADEQVLVENVQIRPIDNSNEYTLSLLLLQSSKNKNLLQGNIDLRLNGKLGNISKTLIYSKLAGSKNFPLAYKFRDFQKINEKIALPVNFKIDEVIIAVTDHNTKQTKTRNFNWDLVGGEEINVAQK